jgi:hypothetical protein
VALLRADALWGGWEVRVLGAEDQSGESSQPEQSDDALNLSTLALALLLILGSAAYLRAQTPLPTPQQGPVSYAALMRFQQSSNEMTGAPRWVDLAQRPLWSDIAELYVQADTPPLRPDASQEEQAAAIARQAAAVKTKLDYSLIPQTEALAVDSRELGSMHERLWVHSGAPGQSITFNIYWFPGWRAYVLDGERGRIISELPVLRENGPLARVVVPVPEGDSYVIVRFEDTPVRTLGQVISLVGWLVVAGLAVLAVGVRLWPRRTPSR